MLEVHIDKGMKGGQQITFAGESDQAPGTIPGDVVIVVEEKPHPTFKRQGDNLFAEINVDLLTALGGGEFSILHLDERAVHVTIKPGEVIKDGTSSFLFLSAVEGLIADRVPGLAPLRRAQVHPGTGYALVPTPRARRPLRQDQRYLP